MALEALPPIPPDIEIAQDADMKPIGEVAAQLDLTHADLDLYGNTKAKIRSEAWDRVKDNPDGKLILVTAMTATRAGEGKTVTSIGLALGMGKLGLRHCLCLREPSLGPTFGIKGGAAGGGYAQVLPMEDINMHFTGDLHAIGVAHNLLAAVVDNHVHFDNQLNVDPERIVWRRVMDLCDRQLRNCDIGLGGKHSGFPHRSGFDITASSEVMAVCSLALDRKDLEERLGRMVVAYDRDGNPLYARQFEAVGAMSVLLRDALMPNIVQTTEHTPALIHCGPFANIAHGCNSVVATKLGLKLADYVITEAGFAADLGAEKFLDIKCRQANLTPAAAVLVVTARARKMHGGVELDQLGEENLPALEAGLDNARVHLENLAKYGVPVVVAINRFPKDTEAELRVVERFCRDQGVESAIAEVAARGGVGGTELAAKVKAAADGNDGGYRPIYDVDQSINEKIEVLAREIYRAEGVEFEEGVAAKIEALEVQGFGKLPLCVAKTQLSISDDPKKLGAPTGWTLRVRDAKVSNGAGFVVIVTGKILLMPGMPRKNTAAQIGMDDRGRIFGLS